MIALARGDGPPRKPCEKMGWLGQSWQGVVDTAIAEQAWLKMKAKSCNVEELLKPPGDLGFPPTKLPPEANP